MTATATVSRPVLYLVPGAHRARPPVAPAEPPGRPATRTIASLAAAFTAQVLGTDFTAKARDLAQALGVRAPLLVRRGRPEAWAAAIAFLLAEEASLFDYPCCGTRTSVARELGSSLPTLRRRVADVRTALAPLRLELPAPDDS